MKNSKILLKSCSIVLVFILLLCSCSAKSSELSPGGSKDDLKLNLMNDNIEEGFYTYGGNNSNRIPPELISEPYDLPERKIIKEARISLESKDVLASYKRIIEKCNALGGFENSYTITNYDSNTVIKAELKIDPTKLDELLNFITSGPDGVLSSSLNADDITDNYYDAKTRLESKRQSLESYYALLQKAKTVEEIVYIQRIIDQVTEDIEALEGKLRVWNSQVDLSTIRLEITRKNDTTPIRREIDWNTLSWDDMGYLIKLGFYSVTNTIISIFQWLIIIVVGYSPIWIIAGLALIVLRSISKKNKNKALELKKQRLSEKKEKDEQPNKEAK